MAIESLTQQASTFVDSLSVRTQDAQENVEEAAQEAKAPDQAVVVSISMDGRALAAAQKQEKSEETSEDEDTDSTIQSLKKQIEKLEDEIKELEDSDLPEKQKLTQIQAKQVQLMDLRKQLLEAQENNIEAEGMSATGGTRANGFGNSINSF